MINGLTFDLRLQNAKSEANVFKSIFSDGIIEGCALSNTSTSITIGAGQFIACGRRVQITADETVNLQNIPASGYARLKFVIDLSETPDKDTFAQGHFAYEYSATIGGFAALTQENINAPGTANNLYEMLFAVYTVSGNALTALYLGPDSAKSGWSRVWESWSRASANTINAPDGASTRYKVGHGIKLTQGGSEKYFYVTGMTYTSITVTGGSDYTLTADPISNIYYAPNPKEAIGFPEWFNWSPTYTGFSVNPSNATSLFRMEGSTVFWAHTEITAGTSNSNSYKLTLPILSAVRSNSYWSSAFRSKNGATVAIGYSRIGSRNSEVEFFPGPNSAWETSGDKQVLYVEGFYQC